MAQYSQEEIDFLKENYKILTNDELAKQIDRSTDSIKYKARDLGLVEEDNEIRRRARRIETPKFGDSALNNFICGFVAGEGSFSSERNSRTFKFEITVSIKDKELVDKIKNYFNDCGNCYKKSRDNGSNYPMYNYSVSAAPELATIIIPFFEKNTLRNTQKRKQYESWRSNFTTSYNINDIIQERTKKLKCV